MTLETITIQPESTEGLEQEANDAALAALETGTTTEQETDAIKDLGQTEGTEERPEWLPEKFKTAEDLAKAYSELESKQGQNTTQAEGSDDSEEGQASTPTLEAFSAEYAETGELSEESYEKLSEMGIPREIVDQYVNGLEATQQAITSTVLAEVEGGEEGYQKMTEWAANTLSEAQLNVFNQQVTSGSLEAAKMAVAGLQAQYMKSTGGLPSGFQMGSTQSSGSNSFSSIAEMRSAMADPRYETDSAYRLDVATRLNNSNIL